MHRSYLTVVVATACARITFAQNGPYCGVGPHPQSENCINARTATDPNGSYQTGGDKPRALAGDCELAVNGPALGDVHISGQEWLDTLDTLWSVCGTQGPGWTIGPNNLNISLYQCRTGGSFDVPDQPCNYVGATIQKRSFSLDDARPEAIRDPVHRPEVVVREPYVGSGAARAVLNALSSRDDTPVCTPDAACEIAECHALAQGMRGTFPIVPSTHTHGCCTVALESKIAFTGGMIEGDSVADNIDRGTDYCNGGGYVSDVYINANSGLDIFFGTLCGQFGQGTGQCEP